MSALRKVLLAKWNNALLLLFLLLQRCFIIVEMLYCCRDAFWVLSFSNSRTSIIALGMGRDFFVCARAYMRACVSVFAWAIFGSAQHWDS